MRRDPLGVELSHRLAGPGYKTEDLAMEGRVRAVQGELECKYRASIYTPLWDWEVLKVTPGSDVATRGAWSVFDPGDDPIVFSITGGGAPFSVQHKHGGMTVLVGNASGAYAREPLLLEVEVKLDRVNTWDVAYLMRRFKAILKDALAAVKGVQPSVPSEPVELRFLAHAGKATFLQDLRRYDLHMAHGLSFRQIALHEHMEKAQGGTPPVSRPRRVGHKMRAESSVMMSVQRIYLAIYRTPYRSRRRRLDHPAEGQAPYICPLHPRGDCNEACPHLAEFWARVEPTLPSEKTGMVGETEPWRDEISPNCTKAKRLPSSE